MNGLVHSINISEGGVPKLPVGSAKVEYGGLEGDYNKFRNKKIQKETSISYLRNICIYPKAFRFFDNVTLYLIVILIIFIYCNEKN